MTGQDILPLCKRKNGGERKNLVLFIKKNAVERQTMKRDIPLGHTNESSATTMQQTIQQRKGVNAEGEPSQRDRGREK